MSKSQANALAKALETEGYTEVYVDTLKFSDIIIVHFVNLAGEEGFHINADRDYPQYY